MATREYEEDSSQGRREEGERRTVVVPTSPALYATDAQLEAYVTSIPGLSPNLVPILREFSGEVGFSIDQLERLVSVASENCKSQGRNQKVVWFLRALTRTYGKDGLASLAHNRQRYDAFLEVVDGTEDIRTKMASTGDPKITYDLCFKVVDMIGPERAEMLHDRLISESGSLDSSTLTGIKALYTLGELLDESEKTGFSPEVLLDFRRAEIPDSYFSSSEEAEE